MGDQTDRDESIRRRTFLKIAGGAAAATALGGLGACAPATEGPGVVEVPLDSIPMGGRLEVRYGEMPVELTRDTDGVIARSLWCTHTGCDVKWKEDEQIYFCACHEGKYDAKGEVMAGPPPRPLRQLPITVTDTLVKIGETV